jgi:glycosyltransferase involved in cell wall biosynthesis
MSSPLISVILPSYNHEEYLPKSIESVLDQTVDDLEIVVIDDGSDDSSPEIIRQYADRDGRVRPIFHEQNQGIPKTMNDGLSAANGEFIAQTASDDLWAENKLERQLEVYRQHPGSVIWTAGEIIDGDDEFVGQSYGELQNVGSLPRSGDLFGTLLQKSIIFHSSLFYPNDVREGIWFDEELKYLNDYKYSIDLAAKTEYIFIDEKLTYYRMHGNNTVTDDEWTETSSRERINVNNYILNEYSQCLNREQSHWLYLRNAADYCKAGKLREGVSAFKNAVQSKPFSHKNALYGVYLCSFLVPGGAPFLRRLAQYLRYDPANSN